MANRMAQQQALDRQTAVAQQQMDLAQTKEQRDITQSQIDNDGKKIDFYTKRAGQTMNAAGYELLLRDMKKDSPAFEAAFRANLPPERFDRNELLKMVGSVSDNFKATYGPLETQVVQLANGDYAVTVTGGFGKPGVFELEKYSLRSGGAPPAAPTAPPPAAGVQPMAAPRTPTGGMFQPISATGGQPQSADPQAALLASLTEADKTKQISADVVEQLRQLDPRAAPAVDQFLAQRNIQVSPSGGMRSAVYRPDGNAMAPQQVQFDPSAYVATGQTARGKPLMQSPTPGIYNVPAPQIAGAAAAEEGGKQGVRVTTEPVIAGGKKKAELQAEKEIAFPDAQGQFESALTTIDNRLDYIKRFREHPARDRVIGPMDAFTPNTYRARGAQEIYNALVATATLDELQKMREASKTGGALGNVSDADIRILRQSIGALGQDQPEQDFNESLKIFESQLKQTRERLVRRYRENYGYKLGKSWNPPTFTARAKPAGGRSSGGFTVMEVED